MNKSRSLIPILLITLSITAAFFLYYPGFIGPLLFDDGHVLKSNQLLFISSLNFSELVRAMESFTAGGRQISMLSFALNIYFLGDSSWWLKCINAVIHCSNGVLLFLICTKIVAHLNTNEETKHNNLLYLPIIATTLWLVAPINLTSVLYISQRMTLLSSFFILAGILVYIFARSNIQQPARRALYLSLIILVFTTLGYLSKENGALLPLFIAVIEVTVFRLKLNGQTDKFLLALFGGAAIVGTICVICVLAFYPEWLIGGYKNREFSLGERVMTQFRALVFYISQIILPSTNQLNLWHDDFSLSQGLFSPKTTFLSVGVLITMVIAAIVSFWRLPLISLGIFWFFIAHSMESTIIPLEMMHEHRNYLASFGIILTLTYLILKPVKLLRSPRWASYLILCCMVAWSANTLYERSNIWSDKYTLAEHNAKTAPLSPSANITLARLQYNRFIEGESEYGEKSKTLFLKTISLKPDQITEEFSMIVASEYGAFEYDSEWLNDAIAKLPQSTPTANVKNAIRSYLKCLHANRCKKSEKEAHKFFDALLESNFSSFRNFYALYYSKIDNQPEKSEPVFESLTQSSSTDYWLNYLEHLSEQPVLQPFCTKYAEFAKKLRNFEFKRITKHINAVSRFESLYKRCPV